MKLSFSALTNAYRCPVAVATITWLPAFRQNPLEQ
jgi:hypothetical protein